MNTSSAPINSLLALEPVTPQRQRTPDEDLAHIKAIRIAEKHRSRWAGHNAHGHEIKFPQYVIDALQEALLIPKEDTEVDFYTRVEHVDFSVAQFDSQEGVQVNIDYKNEGEAETTATLVGSRDALWQLYSILGSQLAKTKPNPIAEERKSEAPKVDQYQQSFGKAMLFAIGWILFVSFIIVMFVR